MLNYLERTFGVEMELVITGGNGNAGTRQALCTYLAANGIIAAVEGYNHTTRNHWKLTTDCTIRTDGRGEGCEIVSPILRGEAGFLELKKVCELINNYGVWSNSSCATHVHIQADDLSLKQHKNIAKAMLKYEWVIDRFVSPSRRGRSSRWAASNSLHFGRTLADRESNYSLIESCQSLPQLARLLNPHNNGAGNSSRYHVWNYTHIQTRGTLENRQHQATQDYDKISRWLLLQMGFLAGFADSRLRPSKINHRPQANAAHHQTAGNLTLDKGIRRLFKNIKLIDGTIDKDTRKFYQNRVKELDAIGARRSAA